MQIRRAILALTAALACAASSQAQVRLGGTYEEPAPTADALPELEGVTIVDKLDSQVPLDATFRDERGRTVSFRDVLPKDRPAILQIGYLRCPMLCSLVMNALVRGIQGVDWTVGGQYDVISLSVNPSEGPELADAKKAGYVAEYGRPQSAPGWHFLTGDEAQIRRVTEAVGFEYRLQENGEYSHAAAVFVLTPDGRLSRVLYGVKYQPADVRMALLEASQGRIGTTLDRIILWCHVYDASAGGYVLLAMRVMQLGGALTLAVLGGGLGWFWWREAHARSLAAPARAAQEPAR
ncbi:MAG: SCO family protein [Planctomycetota bacterium]|jgi:protein SCO1/2